MQAALDPQAIPKKLLLHVCCAPCSSGILQRLVDAGANFAVYFYNPNIHPREEYEQRKQEVVDFCAKKSISYIDGDYDVKDWFLATNGLEQEPERGARCTECFLLRLRNVAEKAKAEGCDAFATSLSISRHKDIDQVHTAGLVVSKELEIPFWEYNWRKGGGQEFGNKIAKQEQFYRQTYCGCVYSLRD